MLATEDVVTNESRYALGPQGIYRLEEKMGFNQIITLIATTNRYKYSEAIFFRSI